MSSSYEDIKKDLTFKNLLKVGLAFLIALPIVLVIIAACMALPFLALWLFPVS